MEVSNCVAKGLLVVNLCKEQPASKFATDNQALPNLKRAIWSMVQMTNLSLQAQLHICILISNVIWLSIIFGKLL